MVETKNLLFYMKTLHFLCNSKKITSQFFVVYYCRVCPEVINNMILDILFKLWV